MNTTPWELLQGMYCTCPPKCTHHQWGDQHKCDPHCTPCQRMAGKTYTRPGKKADT